MSNKLKVSINRHIINKIEKSDKQGFSLLTREFENVEITLRELADQVNLGHPFCAQHRETRKSENFICSDVLAVDIDDGMRLNEALENEFVKLFGGFVYTTPSHTPDSHRFRIVFQMDRTISDPLEMRAAYQGLIRKFGGDASCKDACRPFYGSSGSDPIMLSRILPLAQLDHLIALGRDAASVPDHNSTSRSSSYNVVARRSSMELKPSDPVTLSDGRTVAFADAPDRANIHCPVHIDRNPSAFVLTSRKGDKGVYCHSCAATFWMRSTSNRSYHEYDFYRAEGIIREQEYFEDPVNYCDEDERPCIAGMAREERSSITSSRRFLCDKQISIGNGVTFLRSPKASGKTELLAKKVADFRAEGKSVLLIGHRQALIQSMAARLALTCYFYSDGGKVRNNRPSAYYAICVDSMAKLLKPRYDKYDVVIIDESEQVFSHLTGGTLGEKRRPCFLQLFHYLSVAKSVIVADADLGPISIEGVFQAMGPDTRYCFHLNDYRESQRDFHQYGSETHLMQDMLSGIRAGGRYYVTTNSRAKAVELQESIRLQAGDNIAVMLVTSKTAASEDVQFFLANIKTEILNYDVVIASPTIGTGIDITFENGASHIDTVYGFFVSRVNTHFDIDQQLSRVRSPKAIKVWVSPEEYCFETEPEVILHEAKMNGALNDALIGYCPDGSPFYSNDERYLNVYANVVGIARASKNRLLKNLLGLRARNGWNVIYVDVDVTEATTGKVVQSAVKDAIEKARIKGICAASELTPQDYDVLRESTGTLTEAEEKAMRRFELEKFYRTDVSGQLVVLDDKGTYRRKLELLEIYLSSATHLARKDLRDSEFATIVTDTQKRMLKHLLLKGLLTSAGLADAFEPIRLDSVVSNDNLDQFIDCCEDSLLRLQDLFGLALRRDFREKPILQLSKVLGLIGLSLQLVSTKQIDGQKTRQYSINGVDWETARSFLERRMSSDMPPLARMAA